MHPYDVLVKPLLSEKSNRARENEQQYVFAVQLEASKDDVKKAVETMFGVQVEGVRTLITRDKLKKKAWWAANNRPSRTKKALVKLKGDQKIALFEDL